MRSVLLIPYTAEKMTKLSSLIRCALLQYAYNKCAKFDIVLI